MYFWGCANYMQLEKAIIIQSLSELLELYTKGICSTWKLEQVVLNYMRACHSTKVFPKTKYTISKEGGGDI